MLQIKKSESKKIHLSVYDEQKCFLFALGRNAMYAACQILRLKTGDEILTPAFDCDGALQPFRILGLNMRLFRSDPHSFIVDIEDIKKKITAKTKLIHIINHFGMPQPWDELIDLRQETGIPILEDNAYSLFSKIDNKPFGTFGDFSIFSLRKNLPLIDGGLLRINNPAYNTEESNQQPRFYHSEDILDILRISTKKLIPWMFARNFAKRLLSVPEALPPLYSDVENGIPNWPPRDAIGKDFSCNYQRPISRLGREQLSRFNEDRLIEISDKKRYYYNWLVERLANLDNIKVLWPVLPEGIVPFCVSFLIDSNRDSYLEVLRKKYDVMSWPTLPGNVLQQLKDFPEIELLGRKLLQINLPADKVVSDNFPKYLSKFIYDISCLVNKYKP